MTREGREERYSADIVVVACGALSSALLLLRSANDAHPHGLANGSGQLGRNYMRHHMSVLMAIMPEVNDTVFQKTLAFSDYYFRDEDWEYPLGLVQMCATSHSDQIRGESLPEWLEWLPECLSRRWRGIPWTSGCRPRTCRIPKTAFITGMARFISTSSTNPEALPRLERKLKEVMNRTGHNAIFLNRSLYLGKNIPIGGTAHQAGTARFGTDPASSVLDLDCKAHELDNLYLADASFFPAIGAVNPTLTIIANALRVADRIGERLR